MRGLAAISSIVAAGLLVTPGLAQTVDRWTGTSTAQDAGRSRCRALSFDLRIKGAVIEGSATSPGRRGQILWGVSGRRDGASVTLETTHREKVDDETLPRIRWAGSITADRMDIMQSDQSSSCAEPRRAQLRRS